MIIDSRSLAEAPEFRSEGNQLIATGVAIRYNSLSKDLGGFVERCLPGCTTKTLQERDIRAVANHDESMYLGRTGNGTLRFENSDELLRYDIDLPDTSAGRETAYLLERRDYRGSSFKFGLVQKPIWSKTDSGQALRSLPEIALFHVSPVFTPAYDATEAALRSFAEERGLEYEEVREAAEGGHLVELIDIEHRTDRTSRRTAAPEARSESDDDPVALAQAVDAALDEASNLFSTCDVSTLPAEVAQGVALVTAAETTVDQLLDVLGIYDADDDDDAPGETDGADIPDVGGPDSAPMGPMPGYLTV